jgi:hypothetical protein
MGKHRARDQVQLDLHRFKGGSAKPEGSAHLGDAIQAWMDILDDSAHTHFLVLVYDDIKEKVEVYAKGGDYGQLSSREECLNRVKDLYNHDIPCWGAYSFRAVKNNKPGNKDHDMHYAAFLLWPQHHHIEQHKYQGIQHVKASVKSRVFANADVFVEVHDFNGVVNEDQWRRHQGATNKGAQHCDFGGGDNMRAKSGKKKQNLATELADRAEGISRNHGKAYASNMADEEMARRIQEMMKSELAAEAERLVNQEIALGYMEQERSRRIEQDGKANVGSEESAIRHSMLMKEMFSANHMEKMDERARRGSRRQAADQMDRAQSDKIGQWEALEQQAEQIRLFAREKAMAHIMDEQKRRQEDMDGEHARMQNARRVSANIHSDLADAHASTERKLFKRNSLEKMDAEQERRTQENGTNYKQKLNARDARKRQSMHEEVVKVVRIINHHDQYGNLVQTTESTETKFVPAARAYHHSKRMNGEGL